MKGYKVMCIEYTPGPIALADIYHAEYSGKVHTDLLAAHDELWDAEHDGEVYDPYLQEVEL